jgi:hypothetical protein
MEIEGIEYTLDAPKETAETVRALSRIVVPFP